MIIGATGSSMRKKIMVTTARAANPGSSSRLPLPLPTQARRFFIRRMLLTAALNVLVLLLTSAAAAASSAASSSRAAANIFVASKEKRKSKKKVASSSDSSSSSSTPQSSSLLTPPTKSDRERGWPPFYPRRFSSSSSPPPNNPTTSTQQPEETTNASPTTTSSRSTESGEKAAVGRAETKAGAEEASDSTRTAATNDESSRSLPTPPLPTPADASENKKRSLPLLAPSSNSSISSTGISAHTTNASAPSVGGGVKTLTFFRRSRTLFRKNGTSPAAVEVEEKSTTTTTTTTTTSRQPLNEAEGGPPTSGGATSDALVVEGTTNASNVGANHSSSSSSVTTTVLHQEGADESGNQSTTTSHNASASSTAATAPDLASSSTQQQQQQQPAGGLILLGTPPPSSPYRIYRRGTAGGLTGLPGTGWDPTAPPTPGRGGTPTTTSVPPASSSAVVVLAELATSVLGTVTRILLLRSITGWLAKQEEAMAPTQHFVWECLNDRFVRDESALSTALSAPPAGVSGAQWRKLVRARARSVRRAQHEREHRIRQKEREQQLRRQQQQQTGPSSTSTVSLITSADADDVSVPPRFLDPATAYVRTVVVVELTGEGKDGPDNEYLADIVTFLLSRHRNHAFGTNATSLRPTDLEVVVLVQSPGGSVAAFGLAAAQVRRLTLEPGIRTTVCVDKYAASGGYMIASQAHQLIAAPFASVGSVGVILEGLNFHELAKKYGVQPLVIKAGESKNPITTFGSITKQDMDHQKDQLEKVHVAFKDLVVAGRPALADKLEQVANGNVFLGEEARALDLVDRVATSSQYLLERIERGDRVLKLHRSTPSRFPRRVGTLSPLDILPHLQSRFALLRTEVGHIFSHRALPSWIVQGATYVSLCHHLYSQYWRSR